jgi:alpha-beta hydrolase superfamily lysophospholipase
VTLRAADGAEHDALLHVDERAFRARVRRTGRRTAVMHVHGIMGNFLVGTLRFLAGPLARAGYPTLVLETRMGNVGQLFGQAIFDDALQDLDAGVEWLRAEGYEHLVLSGYSSGAAMATRYAAVRHLTGLRGLVGLGNPWGLPQSAEGRMTRWRSRPSYREVTEEARRALEQGGGHGAADRLLVIKRAWGPTTQPRHCEIYTYRTWMASRAPEAEHAMSAKQIAQVRAPILLVQGTADEVVLPEEAGRLAEVAREAGNRDVEVVPIEGAGHAFAGGEQHAVRAVLAWLDSRA